MAHDPAKAFWDARAEESALYFVDNRLDYGAPDEEAFWGDAENTVGGLLGALGVGIEADDDVLDIGCGVGRLTRVLAAHARHVHALDVSPRMLELARQYNPHLANVTWLEGDGRTLAPIATESVDACVSHVVFQHIPDPDLTLGYVREMGRVLRPGGWSAFQVSDDPRVHAPAARWRRGLRAIARRGPSGQDHPNWRGSGVDLDQLRQAAADGGMDVELIVGEGTQYCGVRTRKPR
jgi:SAM-dependent methyltransferase